MAVFSISVYPLEKDRRGGDTRYAVLQSAIDVLVIRVTLLFTVRYIDVVVTRVTLLFAVRYRCPRDTSYTAVNSPLYRGCCDTRHTLLFTVRYNRPRDTC